LLARYDRAGAMHAFLDHVYSRGLRFSVGLDLTEPVRQAILALPENAWQPALVQGGGDRGTLTTGMADSCPCAVPRPSG
jgi:hypothetical protein